MFSLLPCKDKKYLNTELRNLNKHAKGRKLEL